MTSTAVLASLLRGLSDDALVAHLRRRAISVTGIRDYFDLADALLDPASLQQCLERFDRRTLTALIALGITRMPASEIHTSLGLDAADQTRLKELQLVNENDDGIAAWPEVLAQLARWPALGLAAPHVPEPEPVSDPVSAKQRETADHVAAEHAFTAATATAELLFELDREPVRLLARGSIGNPEKRRLAEAMGVEESSIDTLVGAAELAGLVHRDGQQLLTSAGHDEWLSRGAAQRWATLAEAWVSNLPAIIRPVLSDHADTLWGAGLRAWLHWNYPGGRTWLAERVTAGLAEAERLGITAGDILSTPGAALLGQQREDAIALVAAALPAPVDRLYLQHDLTAVAPGPLEAALDARLRTMALNDGRSLASRYRFTPASIGQAITSGETAKTILAFLGEVSLSGVPQPLEYLITETAARHGLLRVGALPSGTSHAASYVRSDDTTLLSTVLIDRSLAVLDLQPADSDRVVSRRDRNQVYWALREAHYPVTAEDSRGHAIELSQPLPAAKTRTAGATTSNPYRTLVERLRLADEATPDDTGQAWFARELESAIRTKASVVVSVRMPGGDIVEHRLEPTSVASGRLRARDPVSEIERTLPLSSIAALRTD